MTAGTTVEAGPLATLVDGAPAPDSSPDRVRAAIDQQLGLPPGLVAWVADVSEHLAPGGGA